MPSVPRTRPAENVVRKLSSYTLTAWAGCAAVAEVTLGLWLTKKRSVLEGRGTEGRWGWWRGAAPFGGSWHGTREACLKLLRIRLSQAMYSLPGELLDDHSLCRSSSTTLIATVVPRTLVVIVVVVVRRLLIGDVHAVTTACSDVRQQ